MYGRAKCKVCGKEVVAEIEKNIRCPWCERIFQIPNKPQYIIGAVSPYRSIPPITSTGPTRSLRVSTLGLHIQSPPPRENEDWQVSIQPKQGKRVGHRPKIPFFPERGEPELIEDEDCLWLIVEFPRHKSLEEIRWHRNERMVVLESTIFLCPYQNEILLPEWAGEPTRIRFRNGILEMRFKK